MIKRMFGLFVALSFVLILAACAEPSAIQKSFEEQALEYNIHLKALIQSGYLSTVDSYHPYIAQLEGDSAPKSYNARRMVFAYPGLLEFLRSHIVLGSWDVDSLKA